MFLDIEPLAAGSTKKNIGLAMMFNGGNLSLNAKILSETLNLSPLFSETLNKGLENSVSSTKFVIPLTGNLRAEFINPTSLMINTEKGGPVPIIGKPFTCEINFETPLHKSDITFFNANPAKRINIDIFAIFNERSNEVHLKGMQASDNFDYSRFQNQSKFPNTKNLFSDNDNFVWAIMTPKYTPHTTEQTNIMSAFPKFKNWVNANGTNFDNWYEEYNSSNEVTVTLKKVTNKK